MSNFSLMRSLSGKGKKEKRKWRKKREISKEEGEMREIEVVYEKGVFKPLENVELKEGVKGKVRIEEGEEGFEDFERFFGIFKGKEIHIDEERDEMIRERISDRHENIS